jgi:GT2 family glycosyltransferase
MLSDLESGNKSKLLSIIIPVFNQLTYTQQCLEALYQTISTDDTEIIVVDDCSSDGTSSFLETQKDRIHWIRNKKNLGFGGGCNAGAQVSTGKYFVFLNNDTKPQADWIEPCLKHFEDPMVGIVGSKLLYPDGTIQHGGIQFSRMPNFPMDFPLHRFRGMKSDDPLANKSEEVHAITAACLFIPRKLFMWLKGFPEEYGMYFEDVDLNMQVRAMGRKIIYEPRSVVIHYESKSTSPEAGNELLGKAAHIFYSKWGSKLPTLLSKSLVSPIV